LLVKLFDLRDEVLPFGRVAIARVASAVVDEKKHRKKNTDYEDRAWYGKHYRHND
jgi:hypothetical protein